MRPRSLVKLIVLGACAAVVCGCVSARAPERSAARREMEPVPEEPPPLEIVHVDREGKHRCIVELAYARDGSLAEAPIVAGSTGNTALDERCRARATTLAAAVAIPEKYRVPLRLKRVLWIAAGDDDGSAPATATVAEGGLSREEIQRAVSRGMAQIKYCYEKQLNKRRELEGKLMTSWIIDGTGAVAAVAVDENTFPNDPGVEPCVVTILARLRYPSPKGGGLVFVTYPFVFSSSERAPAPTR